MLKALARQETLTTEQAALAMHAMMRGDADAAQVAGLLMGMRTRGETINELTGLASAMREHATAVDCHEEHAIDLCGTGGDGSGTFNISTAAALTCAGAGALVAKHGNRSVSSKCGSADVLEALGVVIDLSPDGVARCFNKAGLAFIFARRYHPAMRYVAPVRAALGVRTCFNILGPLCNPARVQRQLVGAFSIEAAETMARVLARLGARHVITVAAHDGLDEISLSGPTEAFEHVAGRLGLRRFTIHPEHLGIKLAPTAALTGDDKETNAAIITAILEGMRGAERDVVLLNSAYALCVSGMVNSAAEGLDAAMESIDSGEAKRRLQLLRAASRG